MTQLMVLTIIKAEHPLGALSMKCAVCDDELLTNDGPGPQNVSLRDLNHLAQTHNTQEHPRDIRSQDME